MNMFAWMFGKSKASPRNEARQIHTQALRLARKMVSARFDAAQHTEEDRRYWSLVDNLSADAAHSPQVRTVIRNRAAMRPPTAAIARAWSAKRRMT